MTQDMADASLGVATEQGFPFWSAFQAILLGWVSVNRGKVEEGVDELRRASYLLTQQVGSGVGDAHLLSCVALGSDQNRAEGRLQGSLTVGLQRESLEHFHQVDTPEYILDRLYCRRLLSPRLGLVRDKRV